MPRAGVWVRAVLVLHTYHRCEVRGVCACVDGARLMCACRNASAAVDHRSSPSCLPSSSCSQQEAPFLLCYATLLRYTVSIVPLWHYLWKCLWCCVDRASFGCCLQDCSNNAAVITAAWLHSAVITAAWLLFVCVLAREWMRRVCRWRYHVFFNRGRFAGLLVGCGVHTYTCTLFMHLSRLRMLAASSAARHQTNLSPHIRAILSVPSSLRVTSLCVFTRQHASLATST